MELIRLKLVLHTSFLASTTGWLVMAMYDALIAEDSQTQAHFRD